MKWHVSEIFTVLLNCLGLGFGSESMTGLGYSFGDTVCHCHLVCTLKWAKAYFNDCVFLNKANNQMTVSGNANAP